MGLSSKQVSNDVQPWNNHHHPLPQSMNCTEEAAIGSTVLKEPPKQLPVKRKVVDHHHHGDGDKCPRCGSGNTKFCYYNNYNKTQPRHFCKECKRHWTKGGTLRNVPVGGGRKHKRIKISSSSSNSASAKSIGLVGVTDKKSNLTHSSSSSIVKPQQQYSLSPQFSHIFDSSTTTVNDNTNDLFMGKISAASPSTDHRHHMVEINHLLDFSGSSTTTLPYQSFSTTPSTLDESLSIFNSSDYNSSFQTSTYGYTSDQSTSLELEVDGTLTFGGGGGGTNSMNYDQSWKSNNLQLGWDEIDKFVSSDEIDV